MAPSLVTGATGLLGPYLCEAVASLGEVVGVGRRGGELSCDLRTPAAVAKLCETVRPGLVIHAVALTDVDGCERSPTEAVALNQETVKHLATSLPTATKLVLISTDQVYPDKPGLHVEGCVGPVNAYGRTKLAGEAEALSRHDSLVLRVNLFGPSRTAGRRSLSDFFVEALRAGTPVKGFSDALFSPLHMATLSQVVVEAVEAGLCGVYNLGSRDGFSKLGFCLAVGRHLGLSTAQVVPTVRSSLPGRAPRPQDTRMDVSALEAALGHSLPSLAEEITKL